MINDIRFGEIELETKPDFEQAMKRVYAWYNQEIIDRAPIRFSAHNAEYLKAYNLNNYKFNSQKDRWCNVEYQLDKFELSIHNTTFNAETFPFYWPNLGPDIFAAFYGSELVFQDITSFSKPLIYDWEQLYCLQIDLNNEYFLILEDMTKAAIERGKNKYLVGYTSFVSGIDTAAAFRGVQQLCFDFILEPEKVKLLIEKSSKDYLNVYNHFDKMIKNSGGLSISWMGIPSFEKMQISQTDFASMLSPEHFNEFVLPNLKQEVQAFDQVIFHMDGKGVANHLDSLLGIPEINAIQWVQGVGKDLPIMQWVPLIKNIQKAGKSVVVDLQVHELEHFMKEVSPEGIYLCIDAEPEIQFDIIKRVLKWK